MRPKLLISDIAKYYQCGVPNIYKKLKSKGISHQLEGRRSYLTFNESKELFQLIPNDKVFTFYTPKGGVGKTSIGREFGIRANLYGLKVLFVDIDHQACLTESLGYDSEDVISLAQVLKGDYSLEEAILSPYEGLHILPSNDDNSYIDDHIKGSYNLAKLFQHLFKSIYDKYDLIIIDPPPSNSRIVVAANLYSDLLIIPAIPDDFSPKSLKKMIGKIDDLNSEFDKNIHYKIILNNYDARKEDSLVVLSSIMNDEKLNKHFMRTTIGTTTEFQKARKNKESIYDPTYQRQWCSDIDIVTRELIGA